MTPAQLDRQVVARRLRLLRDTLDELASLCPLDAAALGAEALRKAAVERFIQVLVDLAADINAHIVVSQLGSAPATTSDSFRLVADVGVLPIELVDRLVGAAGLRNLLVHRYADIDVTLLAGAGGEVVEGFEAYVGHVARWISESRS